MVGPNFFNRDKIENTGDKGKKGKRERGKEGLGVAVDLKYAVYFGCQTDLARICAIPHILDIQGIIPLYNCRFKLPCWQIYIRIVKNNLLIKLPQQFNFKKTQKTIKFILSCKYMLHIAWLQTTNN